MAYNVYSFPDVKAGRRDLHRTGMGKITVSSAWNAAYAFPAAAISGYM